MMARYKIGEHDGGWAYTLGDVFSETFPTQEAAHKAAEIAAARQQVGGDATDISYQDGSGTWRNEHVDGGERPETEVVDAPHAEETHLP